MLKQLNFSMLNKTEVAIQRLKQHEPPDGYYLGFSGGKDSIVIVSPPGGAKRKPPS